MQTAAITMIPLSKLVPSKQNVRKTSGGQSVEQLAASIAAHGLFHNLVVVPVEKNGEPSGKFGVIAGGRRLAALKLLVKRKTLAPSFPVPCAVRTAQEAAETSLAENVQREPMNMADEVEAFRNLVERDGATVADIAARFGVDVLHVRRRLRLAGVSPKLLALYREGALKAAHVEAFALSDSHEAQEAAWFGAPQWQRTPADIRAALTSGDVDPQQDRRARFVGADAYLAAGGAVREDLFTTSATAAWIDAPLVQRLALDKLEGVAAQVRAEGWAWVEAHTSVSHEIRSRFSRRYAQDVPLSEADDEELTRLNGQYDDLAGQTGADPAALLKLDEQIQELLAKTQVWPPETREIAGVLVSLDYKGDVSIERGFVRPADERAARQAEGADPEAADPLEGPARAKKPISDALMLRLTAQRTMALRAELMERPDVALIAIVHNLMAPIFYGANSYQRPSALEITVEQRARATALDAEGVDGCVAHRAVADKHGWWMLRVPHSHDETWGWLLDQDQETLLQLLAFCAAQTVNAVRHSHNHETDSRLVASNDLAGSLGLNMAKWWQPTKDGYFGAVSKETILEAVREGVSSDVADAVSGMKKAALADEAERRLAHTGWLPAPLRSHEDPADGSADEVSGEDAPAPDMVGADHQPVGPADRCDDDGRDAPNQDRSSLPIAA